MTMNTTRRRCYRSAALALFALLALAVSFVGWSSAVRAATLIDTTPGNNLLGSFAEPNTATYGQTISAPAVDYVLASFTFYMDDFVGSVVDFDAYVYAWDGSKATGSELFSAGPFSTTNNGGNDGLEAFTINTGNLALTPGGSYVLFFSISNRFATNSGGSLWSLRDDDPYSDGCTVFDNNGNDFTQLTTQPWDFSAENSAEPYDMAFQATFVPEPSSLALAAFGILGLLARQMRQRHAKR